MNVRNYTNIQQSRILEEHEFPAKSADMRYAGDNVVAVLCGTSIPLVRENMNDTLVGIPCWSLSAIFNQLNVVLEQHSKSEDEKREIVSHIDLLNGFDASYECVIEILDSLKDEIH